MSTQPDPSARSSRAEISRATHEHGIDAEHTVRPQSREPQNPETIQSSAGGTSVTGASKTNHEQLVEVGTELGYYRLLKKLGEGGMGSVWQAVHTKLDKHVAVKVLPATWSRDPALLTRFEREMKAVGKLEHPHIVRAMDAGEFQGTHYLVMEFNEGLDLSAYVKQRGPQSVTNACEMLRHAALGLAHAHEAGLIHRDIKPSNLFLTKSGKVKILDLGLARVQGDNTGGGQTLTGFGQVLGTPDYMAPEQWENTHAADARSDLYALGCTLFYLLTGKAPFSDEKHSSLVGKMKGHTLDPIPDLKAARRETVADRPKLANDLITDELDALYRKLMSKRPEERFALANELADALIPFGKSRAAASGVLVKESHAVLPSRPIARSNAVAPRQDSRTSVGASGIREAVSPPTNSVGWVESPRPTKPADTDDRSRTLVSQVQTDVSDEPTRSDPLEELLPDFNDVEPTIAHTPTRKGTKTGAKKSANRWPLVVGASVLGLAMLAGIIIKITRKDGTITEIEVPDDAKVEIASKKGATPASRPGSDTPANSPYKSDSEAPPAARIDVPVDFAAERKAAEKLMSLRDKIHWANLHRPDGTMLIAIQPTNAKLPDEPFYVGAVGPESSKLTDDDLRIIAACTRLELLSLANNDTLTRRGFAALQGLRYLRRLELFRVPISDDVLISLLKANPDLESVNLADAPVTEAGLSALRHCPRLREVRLPGIAGTDKFCELIASHCKELRAFYVYEPHGVNPSALVGLPRLRELHISGESLRDGRLDANIAAMAKMPFLDKLQADPPMSDEFLAKLKPLATKLRRLTVQSWYDWDPGVTADGWRALDGFESLEELWIGGIKSWLDGPALMRFADLPNLRSLRIDFGAAKNRRYAQADVAAFRRKRPDVELSVIEGNDWPDARWQVFPRLDVYPAAADGRSIAAWEFPSDAPKPAVVPFTADEATKLQNAWAAFVKRPVEEANSTTGMKFRLIPPSESVIDLPENRHALIRITKPYYLGATEVTVGQFKKFIESTGYKTTNERNNAGFTWQNTGYPLNDDFPVNGITLADCRAFCEWLSKQDGAVYRLPTEAEWNHAAYAGGSAPHGFVTDPANAGKYGWVPRSMEGLPDPVRPVAKKAANPFGLFDVLGNVFEYCLTWGNAEPSSLVDPIGEKPAVRGSACQLDESLSSRFVGEFAQNNTGFRILRQTTNELPPNPYKLSDKPLLVRKGEPLSPQATVSRPAEIPGVRSWTIELASHQSYVGSMAWSPKGDMIVTTSTDRSVRLWDRNGNLKSILLGPAGEMHQRSMVSFSPDGTKLATVDSSTDRERPGTLRIWDVATGTCQVITSYSSLGNCVAWSPDGKQIAFGGSNCNVLDIATGQMRSWPVEGAQSLAWSADSRMLCVSEKGQPTLFDSASSQRLAVVTSLDAKPNETLANYISWSPDGRWIAGGVGNQVHVWDAEAHKHRRTINTDFLSILSAAWHKESQLLGIVGEGGPGPSRVILDTMSGQIAVNGPAIHYEGGFAWSPDGSEFVVHTGVVLQFHDGQTGKLLRSGPSRGRGAGVPAFLSTDGKRVEAKEVNSGERLQFDAETGVLIERRKAPNGHFLVRAPNDRWRAFSGYGSDTEVHIATNQVDQNLLTITTPGLSFVWRTDPAGERIAQAFDRQVLIWNSETGQPLGTLEHPTKVWSFEWSPNGQQIATAAEDKTIRLWDARTQQMVNEFKRFPQDLSVYFHFFGQPILAWTPDGRSLWIPLGTHAGLLDLAIGRVLPVENFSNGNVVGSLTLAPDGDRLLIREGYGWTFLRDRDGSRLLLGQSLGWRPQWHPDSRRFLGTLDGQVAVGERGYDVATRRRLGTLWPMVGGNDWSNWLCIGPDGHWRGSEGVEEHLVYVTMTDDGCQRTYSAAEFAEKFGWKNDPNKAILLGKSESSSPPIRLTASDLQSNSSTKPPASDSVASLTPNKTAPITPSKTKLGALLEDVAALPPALNIPVSASKVEIPATLPKPKSGQPASVRQIVTKPASLKDLASWSVEPAGHLGAILAMSWSPSGEFLLTGGGNDDSLRLWRVEAGPKGPELRLHRLLLGERGGIQDAQFSPDGRTIAAVTFYGHNVAFYDVASGRRLSDFSLKDGVGRTLQWTSDGKQVFSSSSPRIAMIDPVKGQIRTAEQTTNYVDGALSSDERWIVAMDEVGKLRWFDSINLKVVAEADLNTGRVGSGSLDWSPDGQSIVIGCHNDAIQLWDASAKRKVADLIGHQPVGAPIGFVAFEPDRRRDVSERHEAWPRLVSASESGELIVWNIQTKQPLARMQSYGQIKRAAWSPNGKWIAAAGYNRLAIFDASTGKELTVNETGRGFIEGTINLANNGKTLRLHHSQGLSSWSADTGEATQRVTDFLRGASLASPDDQWLAVYDSQQEKDNLWIVDSETCLQRTSLRGHIGGINAVNWSPNSKQLASASTDKTVRIWNVSDGQQTQQLDHDRAVRSVIWSPDGQQLATCADDDIVRIWSISKKNSSPRPFDRLPSPVSIGPYSMNWSPDGKLIALAAADAGARVLDIKTGRISDPFISFVASMQCVAWSPDGKQILAANYWEVGYRAIAAKESAVVAGLGAPIFWHPDKRRFVTGCWGSYPIQAFDTRKVTKLGTLIPRFGPNGIHWACIGPDGYFRGSEDVESQLVVVAVAKDGAQRLHSIADFAAKYGWKNDPTKARLMKLDEAGGK